MSVFAIEKEIVHIVEPRDEGRAVKAVARERMGLSHRQFSSAKFREGGVTLDGARALASDPVRAGQRLVVRLREEGFSRACAPFGGAGDSLPPAGGQGGVAVVWDDEDILVVDKSAPLPTQSSPRQRGDTLEARMAALLGGRAFRPVNRLDKGTSGLMVVARHAQAQSALQAQLHSPRFARGYLAVVEGAPEPPEGLVDAPIAKADGPTVRREVRPDGKPSRTRYRTLRSAGGLSLVRLDLESGRTHQIRVHMAHIGCPVAGDFLYGTERADLPGRFALHSAFLSLRQPRTGEALSFESPLPEALARLVGPPPSRG